MSANQSAIDLTSLSSLKIITVSSVYWMGLGVISLVNNSLLLATIATQKRPQTNFHVNVIHLACADLIVGVVQTCVGIKRLYFTIEDIPETSTPFRCSWDQGAITFALQASVTQTLCLTTDRFNAVMFPIFYRDHLTPWHIQILNFSLWGASIMVTIMGVLFGLNSATLTPICTMSATYSPVYFQCFLFLLALYSIITVAEYIIIAAVVRKKQAKGSPKQKAQQSQVSMAIRFILIIYLITWLCTSVFSDVMALSMPSDQSRLIIPYLVGITGVSSAVNFPIYLWKNLEIRNDFLKMVKCWNKVESTPTINVITVTVKKTQEV